MDMGELIHIGIGNEYSMECPFSHDKKKIKPINNVLIGEGGKLGARMNSGERTILRSGDEWGENSGNADTEMEYIEEPIEVEGDMYPLTLAAHHLIPAQESLKGNQILRYIDKDQGKLEENLGYDVNGVENGVWLPGPYAIDDWGDMTLEEEDLPGNAKRKKAIEKREKALPQKVAGHKFQGNYAFAAQELCGRQFHDRHAGYSKFVSKQLSKVFLRYHFSETRRCEECKNRGGDKLTPSVSMASRLNSISQRLRTYLVGPPHSWKSPLFTSAWSEFFMVFSVRKQG